MFCSSECISQHRLNFSHVGVLTLLVTKFLHSVRTVQPIGHGPEPGCSKFGTQEDPQSEDKASASVVLE